MSWKIPDWVTKKATETERSWCIDIDGNELCLTLRLNGPTPEAIEYILDEWAVTKLIEARAQTRYMTSSIRHLRPTTGVETPEAHEGPEEPSQS